MSPSPEPAGILLLEGRYRTPWEDHAHAAVVLADGRLAVVGYGDGRPAPDDSLAALPLFFSMTARGMVEDATIYRDVRYGEALGVARFGTGLAVLVRHRESGLSSVVLYRASARGERDGILFETAGGAVRGQSLFRTADGGLLVGLSRVRPDAPDLVKLDASGSVAWTYRMPDVSGLRRVAPGADGDIFVLGSRLDLRVELARLDSGARERWRRPFPEAVGNAGLRFPGGLAVAGEGVAFLSSRFDEGSQLSVIVVSRFDASGRLAWERDYASGRSVTPAALLALDDGGLAFSHDVRYGLESAIGRRSYVTRVGGGGDEIWRARFGPEAGTTWVGTLLALDDGRLAVLGSTGAELFSGGGDDFDALVAIYSDGR